MDRHFIALSLHNLMALFIVPQVRNALLITEHPIGIRVSINHYAPASRKSTLARRYLLSKQGCCGER
jgi:hypothetical protein